MMAAGFAELMQMLDMRGDEEKQKKEGREKKLLPIGTVMGWVGLPFDNGDGGGEHGGQLLEQMRPIARLFQLLDDSDDNGVVNALGVDLGMAVVATRRGRRGVDRTTSALGTVVEAQSSDS